MNIRFDGCRRDRLRFLRELRNRLRIIDSQEGMNVPGSKVKVYYNNLFPSLRKG